LAEIKTGLADMANSERVHILYISHSSNLYGAEQSLLLLLKDLNRQKFLPTVVLPKDGPLKQALELLSIPVEIVPSLTPWLTRRKGAQQFLHHLAIIPFIILSVWRLRRIIKRYQINLIHSNSLVIIDGGLVARLLQIPHVWHAREILDDASPHNFLFGPSRALSIILSLSDQVIAISKAVAACFYGCGSTSKISLAYNAVSIQPSAFRSNLTIEFREQLGIKPKAPLVAQVTNITPVKGCEDFVHAAAQVHAVIPEAVFLLVGGTPYPDYQQKILDLITFYGLESCFFMPGFRDDVSDVFAAIDLAVLASSYEPFGRVVIEAMQAGRPVVGTAVGGIPEIIVEGVTGLLVPPSSPARLAQAIITILQNPEMAARMGIAGQTRVKEYFSSERYVNEVQKIYESLLVLHRQKNSHIGEEVL
jgi:glycosyltransferase involved in cell wall biosynthesis